MLLLAPAARMQKWCQTTWNGIRRDTRLKHNIINITFYQPPGILWKTKQWILLGRQGRLEQSRRISTGLSNSCNQLNVMNIRRAGKRVSSSVAQKTLYSNPLSSAQRPNHLQIAGLWRFDGLISSQRLFIREEKRAACLNISKTMSYINTVFEALPSKSSGKRVGICSVFYSVSGNQIIN